MNNKNNLLLNSLQKMHRRYTFDSFLKDSYLILTSMGIFILCFLSGLYFTEKYKIIFIKEPGKIIFYFSSVLIITCFIYAIWNFLFHKTTLKKILHIADEQAKTNGILLYAHDAIDPKEDIINQYISSKIFQKKKTWQKYPCTNIKASIIKNILVAIVIFMSMLLFSQKSNSIKKMAQNTIQKKRTKNEVSKKKHKEPNKKLKQKKTKKNKKQKKLGKKKKQKKTNQKEKKEKKKKNKKKVKSKKASSKKSKKNKTPKGGKQKGKKGSKKKKNKKLPQVKAKKEKISPLFENKGEINKSYANKGKRNKQKADISDLEIFHKNFRNLPIFFKKHFISIEDQVAVKRYFNMIRP